MGYLGSRLPSFPASKSSSRLQFMKWNRHMKHIGWLRAFGLIAITLMAGLTLAAQSGDPTDSMLRRLNEQFVPTVFNQDESDIVTPGTVVALKKNGDISGYIQDPYKPRWGLVVYRLPLKYCPISTYKKGSLSMGFFDSGDTASGDNLDINAFFSYPRKYLQIGDKVWIAGFGFGKNAILAEVVTDPYDDGRYCAMLQFPYQKGHPPTPDDAVRMISEVLEVQPTRRWWRTCNNARSAGFRSERAADSSWTDCSACWAVCI